ncbi:UDP-N-acetylmuramoyl-L-alanyl-D-glutamate--26-diaminopimelate ligase [Dissostichus eleginoides]|uniref:UDP-N-acetylmuramoyl-L-alanyl-D-glutamate--26-diaminopimelate ligase n=1 Tax=Dissostichus eleginoides TaxID=100907 RepID=A0AAD9BIZ6_DISEL|nr:UDP-N-acetylmuramoyl-L-alanyl-D-glutamate--26-diaminopimelate ligase [Dissostichus eleginoides]
MELPVYVTASTRRLFPRSGMVEECDGYVHQAGAAATCLCRLHSPLVGSRTRGPGTLLSCRFEMRQMPQGSFCSLCAGMWRGGSRASGRERALKHGGGFSQQPAVSWWWWGGNAREVLHFRLIREGHYKLFLPVALHELHCGRITKNHFNLQDVNLVSQKYVTT